MRLSEKGSGWRWGPERSLELEALLEVEKAVSRSCAGSECFARSWARAKGEGVGSRFDVCVAAMDVQASGAPVVCWAVATMGELSDAGDVARGAVLAARVTEWMEDLFGPGEVPADMAAVGATCQAYLAGLDALGVVGHALFWRYVQSLLVEGAAGRALEAIGRALGQVDDMDVEGTAKTVEGAMDVIRRARSWGVGAAERGRVVGRVRELVDRKLAGAVREGRGYRWSARGMMVPVDVERALAEGIFVGATPVVGSWEEEVALLERLDEVGREEGLCWRVEELLSEERGPGKREREVYLERMEGVARRRIGRSAMGVAAENWRELSAENFEGWTASVWGLRLDGLCMLAALDRARRGSAGREWEEWRNLEPVGALKVLCGLRLWVETVGRYGLQAEAVRAWKEDVLVELGRVAWSVVESEQVGRVEDALRAVFEKWAAKGKGSEGRGFVLAMDRALCGGLEREVGLQVIMGGRAGAAWCKACEKMGLEGGPGRWEEAIALWVERNGESDEKSLARCAHDWVEGLSWGGEFEGDGEMGWFYGLAWLLGRWSRVRGGGYRVLADALRRECLDEPVFGYGERVALLAALEGAQVPGTGRLDGVGAV